MRAWSSRDGTNPASTTAAGSPRRPSPATGILLEAMRGPPVRALHELKARLLPAAPGRGLTTTRRYDFGQNMVGRVRLRMKGPAGATVTLRHAEMLDGDGRLYFANLRTARATDHYTLRGDAAGEMFEPRFTFHGFRYLELEIHGPDVADRGPCRAWCSIPTCP